MNTNRTSCKFFFGFLLLMSLVYTGVAQSVVRGTQPNTNESQIAVFGPFKVISDGSNGWLLSAGGNGNALQYGPIGDRDPRAYDNLVFFPDPIVNDTTVCDSFHFMRTYTTSGIYRDTALTSSIPGYDGIIIEWHLTVNNSATSTDAVTVCDSLVRYSRTLAMSGTYVDSLRTTAGCDSIVTLALTVNHSSSIVDTQHSCDYFTWIDFNTYTSSNYTATKQYTNVEGCDSVVRLHLTIGHANFYTDVRSECDSLRWNGTLYTSNTTTTIHLTNASGCDSALTLNLTIRHSNTGTDTQNPCDSLVWIDGNTYTANNNTATHTLTNAAGCDSVVRLNLTLRHSTLLDTSAAACDSMRWYGATYRESGVYFHQLSTNASGCDRSKRLNLTIYRGVPVVDTVEACDSYTWQGTTYTSNGVYTDPRTDIANHNCMVFDTLRLTIHHSQYSADTDTACNSYTWTKTGRTYTASDIYYNRTTTTHGCDSIDTLYLTIHYSTHNSQSQSACDSFVWHGTKYTTSDTLLYPYNNAFGCASTDTLRLTIQQKIDSVLDTEVCDSLLWGIDSVTYTAGGVYQASLLHGVCHDHYTLNLTVHHSVHHSATQSVCDSFYWASTDSTYRATGTCVYSDTTVHGCDSIETIDLTIRYSTHTEVDSVACDSLLWHDATLRADGRYGYSYTNSENCPSTDTINLTIAHGVSVRDTAVACDSYSWHDTTFTASGEYSRSRIDTLHSSCAVLDTLLLTIHYSQYNNTPVTACDSFHWSLTDSIYRASDTCIYRDTTEHGCEKIDTLTLTVNVSTSATIDSLVCDSVLWHGVWYYDNDTITTPSANVAGCDSITTLNLTVAHGQPRNDTVSGCDTYVWLGNTYSEAGVYYGDRNDTANSMCVVRDTLVLTINASHHSYSYTVECDSFYWRLSDSTYRDSGLYVSSYLDDNGCESLDSLYLVIRHSVPTITDTFACDSLWWHDIRRDTTGTYTYTYRASNSCYTTDTLYLTIHHASYRSDSMATCEHYVWNDSDYTVSGTYLYIDTTEYGCPIADTLHLVIDNYRRGHDTVNTCDSLFWNGRWFYESTDTATYVTSSSVSICDSIATLHLTLRFSTERIDTLTGCNSVTWAEGNGQTYYASNTTDTVMLRNSVGCDSIIKLDLTVYLTHDTLYNIVECDTFEWEVRDTSYLLTGSDTLYHNFVTTEGCTGTDTLYLTMHYNSSSSDTVAACDEYEWENHENYNIYDTTGVYTSDYVNDDGCASTDTLYLTIKYSTEGIDSLVVCDSLMWIDSLVYTANETSATYTLTNAVGCDSTVTLNLTVNYSFSVVDSLVWCDSLTWHNDSTYRASSSGDTIRRRTVADCDSTVTLNLTIHYSNTAIDSLAACDSYRWYNDTVYTASNTTDTIHRRNMYNCDSTVTLNLTMRYSSTGIDSLDVCDSLIWIDSLVYTARDTTARHTLVAANAAGCDSVVTLNLTVRHSTASVDVHDSVCDGLLWYNDSLYTASNMTDTIVRTNAVGCDSVVTLNLTVRYSTTVVDSINVCDSLRWIDSALYTVSNNTAEFVYANANAAGCDSTILLNLTIRYSNTAVDSFNVCDTLRWYNDSLYTASTNLDTIHRINAAGCDSLVTLDLYVRYSSQYTYVDTACDTMRWSAGNDSLYTMSNYSDTVHRTNAVGCDSLVTLNLTVNYSNAAIDVQDVCDSLRWHNDSLYLAPNNTDTIHRINAGGCDSLVTLNLTLRYSTTGIDSMTVCDSLHWHNDSLYLEPNVWLPSDEHHTTDVAHFINSADCDSLVYLFLYEVRASSYSDTSVTACDSYYWADHDSIYGNENDANSEPMSYDPVHVFVGGNSVQCDSIRTLHLTMNYRSTGDTAATVCDSMVWYGTWFGNEHGADHATASYSPQHVLDSANRYGCDSIVTLALTVNYRTTGHDPVTACDSLLWNGRRYYASTNDSHLFDTANRYGCDSTAFLHLTVKYSTESDVYDTIVENDFIPDGHAFRFGDTTVVFYDYIANSLVVTRNRVQCDSNIHYHLHVYWNVYDTLYGDTCENMLPLTWGNVTFYDTLGTDNLELDDILQAPRPGDRVVDSVVVIRLHIRRNTYATVSDTILENQLPWTFNGHTYDTNSFGGIMASDTLTDSTIVITNYLGCDSTIVYNLYVRWNIRHTIDSQLCQYNLPIYWRGRQLTTDITVCDTVARGGQYGVDSITIFNLITLYSSDSVIRDTIVENQLPWTVTIGDTTYTFADTVTNVERHMPNGDICDSLVIYSLYVRRNVFDTIDTNICAPTTWHGHRIIEDATVTHTFPGGGSHGEDSTLTITFHMHHASSYTYHRDTVFEYQLPWRAINGALCHNDTNILVTDLRNQWGCDSMVVYSLIVIHNYDTTVTRTVCNNALPLMWEGLYFEGEGTRFYTFRKSDGRDSVVAYRLIVNDTIETIEEVHACDSYRWQDGNTYTLSTMLPTVRFETGDGCDSIVHLHLTLGRTNSHTDSRTSCEPLLWGGIAYEESVDAATDTLTNITGCDSIVTLHFVRFYPDTTVFVDSICSGTEYRYRGEELTKGGVYTHILTNMSGCDSVLRLELLEVQPPAVSISYTKDCQNSQYRLRIKIDDGMYFMWGSAPIDTLIDGHEHDTAIWVQPSEQTLYTVYADYHEKPLCPNTAQINLIPLPRIVANMEYTPSFMTYESMTVTAIDRSIGTSERYWYVNNEFMGSDVRISYPNELESDSVVVLLKVLSDRCRDSARAVIPLYRSTVYVPTAFTPDEAENNRFRIQGEGFVGYHLYIYNRSGVLVFESEDPTEAWDGTAGDVKMPQGNYVYILYYNDVTSTEEKQMTKRGNVLLIR